MRAHANIFLLPALLLLLSQAAPALAASSDPFREAALEPVKIEAAALLEKGEADQSYELYMRLLRLAPEDDAVNLGLARAATKAKRWNQAVMAYETLLEKYPREAGLYGELANVYMLLGDREAAERSLAMLRSLDGKSTKEETDRALDALESRYSDFQFHGKIRTGLQYDSNANLGPDSNDLDLGGWRVRVDNAEARSSFGAYLGADLDLGKRFFRDSPWWLVGDAQFFWRGHANSALRETHSRESQWGRAAVGLRHLGPSSLAEVRLKGETFDYEFFQRVSAYGPEGTLLWAPDPSAHLILKGNLEGRDYSRDHDRNGLYGSVGAYARIFFAADNHELIFGGRYLGADAHRWRYGYNGWEGMARLLFKLPYGVELSPSFSFTREDYHGPGTALEDRKRRDERLRAGLGLTWRINEDWSLEAGYQYSRNHSTCALFKYTQNFMNLGVVWNF